MKEVWLLFMKSQIDKAPLLLPKWLSLKHKLPFSAPNPLLSCILTHSFTSAVLLHWLGRPDTVSSMDVKHTTCTHTPYTKDLF